MREIGVRELKQALSRTLRDVARGEHVRVTLRGRPVADIVPVGVAASDRKRTGVVRLLARADVDMYRRKRKRKGV